MREKSQTALEYLMSYGWAILIVIIAIGSLYALGLTSPCKWFPTRVNNIADFKIETTKLTTNYLSFDLSYLKPDTIKLHNINVTGDVASTTVSPFAGAKISSNPIFIAQAINTSKSTGDCYNIEVAINYNVSLARGQETFTSVAKIYGIIEKHTIPEDAFICTNAHTSGLCSGLDIVYGVGYQQACCSNYGVCCS